MQNFDQFKFEGYHLQAAAFLGEGSYGKVFKVYSDKNKEEVALKQINMDKIRSENLTELLLREITLMKELKSQYTLQLIDECIGEKYSYMISQLCDGDLRKKMVSSKTRFKQSECIEIFGSIIQGFKVFADHSCIHRDIKPENILTQGSNYKIGDFGFACKADVFGTEKMMQFCGTPIYMAPQLLFQEPYTAKCDIWSLGLMFYELIYGATPWPVRCIESYKRSLIKRRLAFPFDVKVGKQTKDFLKRSLVVDENNRMTWQELLSHPLVKDKVAGETVVVQQVSPKIRKILSMMQGEIENKQINENQIFQQFSNEKGLEFSSFQKLLRKLNPTVTSYEIQTIFNACDKDQNKVIDIGEFEEFFCSINYRKDHQASRELDEIIGILLAKKIELSDLFEQFDANKTGALDFNEFRNMVLYLAPKYRYDQVRNLHKQLDVDQNGLVKKNEILEVIGKGLVSQKHYIGIENERAWRNLKSLKLHIKEMNMGAEEVMKMGDWNHDRHIDLWELRKLIDSLKFVISEQEMKEVFCYIDTDRSDKISFQELEKYLS